MDNFIDKLAQKFTANEMIRANSQAEAKEIKRLKEQVEKYEAILQEMKQLNLKNVESAGKVSELIDNGQKSFADAAKGSIDSIRDLNKEGLDNVSKVTNDGINDMKKITEDGVSSMREITLDGVASIKEVALNSVESVKVAANDSVRTMSSASEDCMNNMKQSAESNMSAMKEATDAGIASMKEATDAGIASMQDASDRNVENMKAAIGEGIESIKAAAEEVKKGPEEQRAYFDAQFDDLQDAIHKENVKVFRNVQATTDESLDDKAKELKLYIESSIKEAMKVPLIVGIVTFGFVIVDIIIDVLSMLGVF